VVDGLLGTGFHPPLQKEYAEIIATLNAKDFWVFSLDVPSGMGEEEAPRIVRADYTLTLGSFKQTFLKHENRCGRIIPLDIGFPESVLCKRDSLYPDVQVFMEDDLKKYFKRRSRNAHKGNFGHVLLIGGAYGLSGALVIAGLGALRSGCGLLTLMPEARSRDTVHVSLNEVMTVDRSALNLKKIEKFDALAIGPGLSTSAKAVKLLSAILEIGCQPLVLDADALNLLADEKVFLKKINRPLILTPHPGEAARLLGKTVATVESDRFFAARTLRKKYNAWIVLKGAHTVVCGPEGIFLHLSGTPAMASGGMGDLLTGMIASFLAQGFSPWDACNASVALQGFAAEELEWDNGPFGILASEVAQHVPKILKKPGRISS
jgi:NAD(P)H-hydrate epimerase